MAVSGTGQGETPQSLVTPAFAGFPPITESGIKAALTTEMTTDRKIFIFTVRRGIMAEIEYPGIAKLVSRLVWDQETVRSSRTTRTRICGFDRTNAAKHSALRRFHHLMDVLERIICLLKLLMQFS